MYSEQIANGIAWLDQEHGRSNWLPRINNGGLNLASTRTCVLGQLYGDFGQVVDFGGVMSIAGRILNKSLPTKSFAWAVKHGFAIEGKKGIATDLKYAALSIQWMLAVRKLRASAGDEPEVPPETPAEPQPPVEQAVLSPVEVHVSPIQNVQPREKTRITK